VPLNQHEEFNDCGTIRNGSTPGLNDPRRALRPQALSRLGTLPRQLFSWRTV